MTIDQPEKSFNSLPIALDYIARHPDRYIFPVIPGEKKPLVGDMLDSNASNDPEQIGKWSAKWPDANWFSVARAALRRCRSPLKTVSRCWL